jgi:hypothetical protein
VVPSFRSIAACCLLWSCSSSPAPEKARAPAVASAPLPEKPARTCKDFGPLAPDAPPASDGALLCEQLRKRLQGQPHRDDVGKDEQELITKVERCVEPDKPASTQGTPTVQVRALNVIGELGEVSAEGSYLVAQRAGGECLIDRLLAMEWYHGGHFETDFGFDFRDANHLTVRAHRLKRIPLEGTKAEPGADVDWEACERIEYELANGSFRRIRASSDEGPCSK